MDTPIKRRRERLIWIIVLVVALFAIGNAMGIIRTGTFIREPTPTAILSSGL